MSGTCARISILLVSTIILLDIRTVQTMWYLMFIILIPMLLNHFGDAWMSNVICRHLLYVQ